MKIFLSLFIVFLITSSACYAKSAFSISFGPVNIGNSRIPLNLSDFIISVSKNNKNLKAIFVKDSVQWIRTEDNLLIPRARLGLIFSEITKNFHIRHHEETIIPQLRKNQYYTEVFVNLFNPSSIEIKNDQEVYSIVSVTAAPVLKGKKSHLIDYSCSRNQIKIAGLDDQYISLGCRMERRGKYGKERPRLSVTWTTSNYSLKDGTPPPYTSFFNTNHPVNLKLVDKNGNERDVTISARVPKRLHRLKIAYGVGPYTFSSSFEDDKVDNIAPAVMLYGKYDFSNSISARFFDALVHNGSTFNNSGAYFAYHLADAMDGRFSFIPLLGIQGLYFKHQNAPKADNNLIYPQGFEMVFRHAFGIENYLVVYGMFFSTDKSQDYTNTWVRWGKNYFWELNYINWGQGDYKTQMFGLSIGFLLGQFF